MSVERDPRTITLKGVRFSFTDALVERKATSQENPDRKTHHLNIIIESSGPYAKHAEANRAKVMDAIRAAGEKAWKKATAWKDITDDNPKRVFYRKGEKFKNKEGQVYAGYEGNYAFSVTGPGAGQRRPRLIDRAKRICVGPGDSIPTNTKLEIRNISAAEISDLFYSGCYGDVTISVYGTDKGSRGIFATVDVLRTYQTGERMAGGYVFDDSDVDDLEDFDDGTDDLDDIDSAPSKPASKRSASIDDDDEI